MAKNRTVVIDGATIRYFDEGGTEYVSLTDIAKQSSDEPRFVIQNWMRNSNTVRYLYEWENLHNPQESRTPLDEVIEKATNNRLTMSPKKWIGLVDAIGITSKSGRYGGTYAHKDIALNFCYWLSPTFQIYLIKEFQRLKNQEAQDNNAALDWTVKRILSKANYYIHTEAIKNNLIPNRLQSGGKSGFIYANEADILNIALFGVTAKQWKAQNPQLNGNMRDFANTEQLLVLANLENLNAQFIKDGLSEDERVIKLNDAAIHQMQLLLNLPSLGILKKK